MLFAVSALMTLLVVSVSEATLEPEAGQVLRSFHERLLTDLGMKELPDQKLINTTKVEMRRMTRKYLRGVGKRKEKFLIFNHTDCDSNSRVVFHLDVDHGFHILRAKLRFSNESIMDSSEAVFRWLENGRKPFLNLPCVRCCGARLELKIRIPSITRSKRSSCRGTCCRRALKVSFKEIGWTWIIQPQEVEIFYCKGKCNGANEVFSSNHALFQSILNMNGHNVTRPCCTPFKLKSLELLHYDTNDPPQLVVTKHRGMIVEECACT
ncbi:bone morphogenetic protein 8A [Nephila pilipes]|uniref:Bone morphogenetic protein 8A n=1 Tax=Nephila pilipes TaxID=299642 RepID=A0A8X6NS40_NEPPI|nr:bone morphogenetic protein 8A [Nephila pilipes]